MTSLPLFLFAFAQSAADAQLEQLRAEEQGIRKALQQARDARRIDYEFLGNTTLDELYAQLNRFHNRLAIFHFSGHSNNQLLALQDKPTRAGNLSTVLGMQNQLMLVFLNGCANAQQVQELWDKGCKVIIATQAKVEDTAAMQFSLAFYQALKEGKTLREAFDTAKSQLSDQAGGKQSLALYRTPVAGDQVEKQGFPWGLYVREADEALLDWTLPDPFVEPPDQDFHSEVEVTEVNKVLVEGLFAEMAKVHRRCALDWEDYQSGKEVTFSDLTMTIFNRLPSVLSKHIRTLFAPAEKEKGRRRLLYMNNVYLVFTQLVTAIALADFWRAITLHPQKKVSIRSAYQKDLRALLEMKAAQNPSLDYLQLLIALYYIKQDNGLSPTLPELAPFAERLGQDKACFSAYRALENLRSRLQANNIPSDEVAALCQASESHLSTLLGAGAFLVNYQLASINDILVHNGLRSKGVSYVHWRYSLIGSDDHSRDHVQLSKQAFTCNHSILLTANLEDDQAPTLVLTPFLIDRNAFNKKANVPRIYFWQGIWPDGSPYYLQAETLVDHWKQPMQAADKDRTMEFEASLQLFQIFRNDLQTYLFS